MTMEPRTPRDDEDGPLRRALGEPAMVLFGLGTIVGAGIYVLIGEIAGQAGSWAPLSFLLASLVAALTGLSYSELVARHPRSAGEAAYVRAAFDRAWLEQAVGWAVVATGLVSAATLARGFAGYFTQLVPVPASLAITALVGVATLVAVVGVRLSVGAAVVITVVELLGLAAVVAAAADGWTDPGRWAVWEAGLADPSWSGIAAGAFLAFYAFIGFEDMVNMAEEVRDVRRTLPRAILLAIAVSTALYLVVALVAVVTIPPAALAKSDAPLSVLVTGSSWLSPDLIAGISLLAISNGVLVQFLMGPRVIYGLSRRQGSLSWLGRVSPRRQTPMRATWVFAAAALFFALALPLARLAQITSAIILVVFLLVNAALIRLRRTEPFDGFRVPAAIPYLAAVSCALLLLAQLGLELGS